MRSARRVGILPFQGLRPQAKSQQLIRFVPEAEQCYHKPPPVRGSYDGP